MVNPSDDTVSVIRTDKNRQIAKIPVGDEPQGVALHPGGKLAFVANTAAGTVTVIRTWTHNPERFLAVGGPEAGGGKERESKTIPTGAEPWNIVISPDGRRAFVANSGTDMITVIDTASLEKLGDVDVRNSLCNDPDRERHFQPRGLAVTGDSTRLYVTRFLSFVKQGGVQSDDGGREGLVCRLDIDTSSKHIGGHKPAAALALAPQVTGFQADTNNDRMPDADTRAFPSQLQSIVIRGDQAFLPNIAASPSGPLRFDVSTHAFVNVIDSVNSGKEKDASEAKFLNLHLGARDPEAGKKRLFFANVWAIAFTNQSGKGQAYAVSAGSDLLVKLDVAGDGKLAFTVDGNTTRYIDLNDPNNPRTSGAHAGKNPQGIVITEDGRYAYVNNFVSRNVSVVNLEIDAVIETIQTADLPPPGSRGETVLVGAEMFFSSRGHFDRPKGTTVSTDERLSQAGWQNCASCHFKGLTDGVVWVFGTGTRKSVPMNGTFNPHDPDDQRVLNYSAIFDEVEDFEINIRNVSGPGPLAMPVPCNGGAGMATLDPNHGLLISDTGDVNTAPCVINAFRLANANRKQLTVTLPGDGRGPIPALTALREWVRFAIRTPEGPSGESMVKSAGDPAPSDEVGRGRVLFGEAGCAMCHGGGKWTVSTKDFMSPPNPADIFTERMPPPEDDNPVPNEFLARFLRDIGSFNIGVPGQDNPLGNNIGAPEIATGTVIDMMFAFAPGALGFDYNRDGKGAGYNVPSLLGIFNLPPYYHNGACETLACVLSDVSHRTAGGLLPDRLADPADQRRVVRFLETITAQTMPFAIK